MFYHYALCILSVAAGDDLKALGDDSFEVRQAESERLARRSLLSVPTLLLGEQSADFEVRRRCSSLLAPKREALRLLLPTLRVGMLWILYRPMGHGWVVDFTAEDSATLEKLSLDWHLAAIAELRRLGLIHTDETTGPEVEAQVCPEGCCCPGGPEPDLTGYMIIARRRALGLPDDPLP